MGDAFAKGMVLVMSLWDDYEVNMHWLNSPYPTDAPIDKPGVARGDCSITSGKPEDVESKTPGATVIFSNVRTGTLGSTYSGALQPGGGSGGGSGGSSSSSRSSTTSRSTATTTRTTTTTSSTRTSTTTPAGGVAQKYAQCGVSLVYLNSSHPSRILTSIAGHWLERPYHLCQRQHLHQGQRLLLPVLVDGAAESEQFVDGMAMAGIAMYALERLVGKGERMIHGRLDSFPTGTLALGKSVIIRLSIIRLLSIPPLDYIIFSLPVRSQLT